MGLSYQVGSARSVYHADYAEAVVLGLESLGFQDRGGQPGQPLYCSNDAGWSWCEALQKTAIETLGQVKLSHLVHCDAWNTVYLPLELAPVVLKIKHKSGSELRVASLYGLERELRAFAQARDLPTSATQVQDFYQRYIEEIDCDCDDDPDLQNYALMWLTLLEAQAQEQPMWVVK
jgi:hypothetical protein